MEGLLLGNNNLAAFPRTDGNISNGSYWLIARYTGLANGTANLFKLGMFDWGNLDGSQAIMTVHDEAGNVIGSGAVTGTAGGWVSGAPATTFPVVLGATYDIVVMVTFGTGYPYQSTATYLTNFGSASSYPTPLFPLVGSESSTGSLAVAVEGTLAASQSIDSVNGGTNTVQYGVPFTWATTGITPATATLAGIACTAVGTGGATPPALVDEDTVPMPGTRQLIATNAGAVSTPAFNVTVEVPDGFRGIALSGTLNTTDTGVLHGFVPAAKVGDYIAWPVEVDGSDVPLPEEEQTVVDAQGNIEAFFVGTREFLHFSVDAGDNTIGVVRTFNVTLGADADETPNPFTFTDVNNATASTQYTSNTVTIGGLDIPVDVSIVGGTYSKNGGAYTSSAGTAQNGDTFSVRITSSSNPRDSVNSTLTVGTYSETYTVNGPLVTGGSSLRRTLKGLLKSIL
jgi:hypothetical protein